MVVVPDTVISMSEPYLMMLYNTANGQRHYRLQRVNGGKIRKQQMHVHTYTKKREGKTVWGRERKWQAGRYTGSQTRKTDEQGRLE